MIVIFVAVVGAVMATFAGIDLAKRMKIKKERKEIDDERKRSSSGTSEKVQESDRTS
jgi:Na+/glutamate symporter